MSHALQQRILNYLGELNSFQSAELLDFLKFLTSKKGAAAPSPGDIDSLRGKYAKRLSSSEDFARNKKNEIRKEQKKWQVK